MANLSISQLATAEHQSISDLFEVAIPDNDSDTGYVSRKVSMATIADFIANDVQLTGLTTEAQNIIDAINEKVGWKDNGIIGAKNLLPYPYSEGNITRNGITFTDNGDGTITLNGTISSSSAQINITPLSNVGENPYEGLKLSGGISTKTVMRFRITNAEGTYLRDARDEGNGVIIPAIESNQRCGITLLTSETSLNNVKISPMLRLAKDTDDTWQPYAATNRELTVKKANTSILGTDESGNSTASQAYAQGDYFVKDGQFCKAITSIASGATFTLNTNYAAYTLADILKAIENL